MNDFGNFDYRSRFYLRRFKNLGSSDFCVGSGQSFLKKLTRLKIIMELSLQAFGTVFTG
jgi:hypothetical protein